MTKVLNQEKVKKGVAKAVGEAELKSVLLL